MSTEVAQLNHAVRHENCPTKADVQAAYERGVQAERARILKIVDKEIADMAYQKKISSNGYYSACHSGFEYLREKVVYPTPEEPTNA